MEIVIYLFDGITALDAVGPYEVLTRLPGTWATRASRRWRASPVTWGAASP